MLHKDNADNNNGYTFPQRVWITGSILALIVLILSLLKTAFNVFLLILAGVLIAVFFRAVSSLIEKKTKWNVGLCLTISVIGTVLIITSTFWLVGAEVQSQLSQLSETLPGSIQSAKEKLSQHPIGKKIIQTLSSPQMPEKAKGFAATFFKTTFGILGDIYVILFLGIFFTVSPQQYKKGIVQLVPKSGRRKTNIILNNIVNLLKKWLKGKLFAMLVVFILTAVGLIIMGIPMWLALALIAGILSFIPNFGPLIALIPAVLVGLMQGPVTAGLVAGLYILVQVIESNFITPFVENKLINIPPALIIISQLVMGILIGGWGLLLASSLMIIVMVIVQETYIKSINREKI
ncbi:MAG: AI-2E family transporter [Chitinophagaceae bacterium]|nr:AI-2E family transporter [Chitinophagaceae bacterium]